MGGAMSSPRRHRHYEGRRLLAQFVGNSNQVAIASKLGLNPACLSRLLSGERRPTLDQAAKIEEVMFIPMKTWTQPLNNCHDGNATLSAAPHTLSHGEQRLRRSEVSRAHPKSAADSEGSRG